MEIEAFLLVYMVDEVDLGYNRRGLALMMEKKADDKEWYIKTTLRELLLYLLFLIILCIRECFTSYLLSTIISGWTYHSESELRGSSHWGLLATYSGAGSFQDLGISKAEARGKMDLLKQNLWLSRATRAVFLDFTVYNANINLFCVVKLVFEFPATGGMIPSWSFRTVKLLRYVSASDYFVLACEAIFVVFIIYYIVEEALEITRNKWAYFKEFWNILDVVVIVTGHSFCNITVKWTYHSESELRGSSHWGLLATYSGAGSFQDLGISKAEARGKMDLLKQNLWLSRATRAVFLDFTVYNANINLFCVVKLVFEFPATGGMIPSWSFRTVKLLRYVSASDYFVLACEAIFVVFIIYYIVEEALEITRNKWAYFKEFWNILDVVVIVMSCICIAFSIYRTVMVDKLLSTLLEDPVTFADFEFLGFWQTQFNNAVALSVFFAWIKFFKYISFNKTMTQLSSTLSRCSKDVAGFGTMFFIIFFAFAQLGYLLFGSQVEDFSSFMVAVFTLLRLILGDFDFEELEAANRVLGPIYFLSYVFFVFFVLMNMFLAIINDTYAEVKAEISLQTNEFELVDYFKKSYNSLMGKLGKRNQLLDLQNALKNADTDGDQKLSYEEVRQKLREQNLTEPEIEMLFARYDVDGNRELDREETRQMLADLEGQRQQLDREIEQEQSRPGSAAVPQSRGAAAPAPAALEDLSVLARRVDRMEHSIGSIVAKIDAVLVKMEAMERARSRRRENMHKILDSISDTDGMDDRAKTRHMERLIRDELKRWDSEASINTSHLTSDDHIYRTVMVDKLLSTLLEDPVTFADFEFLGFWQTQFNNAVALSVFFAWIKFFKYISFNKTMTQLSSTLSRCSKDVAGFGTMFFIIFFAFAQLGYLLFGSQVEDFSSFMVAVFTLLRLILGDFDFEELEAANRVLGPIYFLSYVFFVFFVLMNMFLAIINDTYAEVKAEISLQTNEFELVDYFKKSYNSLMGKLGKRNQLLDLQNALKNADTDGDQKLSYEEVRQKLREQNLTEPEIEMLFARYDVDGNRELDREETRQMLADLEGQRQQLDREIEQEQSRPGSAAVPQSRGAAAPAPAALEDLSVLARRVDRMEHSIGSIVAKIDAVLVKMEAMERARSRRRENMHKILDSISDTDGMDDRAKTRHMERLIRDELKRWDSEASINTSHLTSDDQ
ncbi:PKD2 [Cordylochernes scorpioides]|uniref:PKD2 n=1 Tax=Cordylochernes scorpioides TaxID=51811 RepID=A0ABY6LP13_9ARAC|nr:PKD2 [Cordylochernes scorpioides]